MGEYSLKYVNSVNKFQLVDSCGAICIIGDYRKSNLCVVLFIHCVVLLSPSHCDTGHKYQSSINNVFDKQELGIITQTFVCISDVRNKLIYSNWCTHLRYYRIEQHMEVFEIWSC